MAKPDCVLVIGGSGFIGRVLVAQLLERGCEVHVMSRQKRCGGGVTWHQGDVTDRQSVIDASDGVDVVYDLSMAFGESWNDYVKSFVQGAENVAEVVLERGIRRLIYTSTIAGLHLARAGSITEEEGSDPKPELRSWYARAKIMAEQSLNRLHRHRGLPVVIFRPGMVVGVGSKLSSPAIGVWLSPTCCSVVGGGRTPLPMVLVEDVAQALILAKDTPGVDGRTFNLAGDVRLSAVEYCEIAAERSKRNFCVAPSSPLAIQAFYTLVYLGKLLLGRKDNVWPSWHELRNAPQRTWLNCSAAKEVLGWRPVAERDEFVRRAIDCHLRPLHAGDLRLSSEA
ncbi:MAG TPA: NAD-dependent epimerase/dehydratase family protein [Nitrospira sp.]|nr:NAD-dependent epimerase/dehydratase family protein [Nitrospira sp.]